MKKIVIIGGGISGLSAGIFAQKNGYKSVIIEKHNILGGECTGWDRQGYHIDGCIHWLVGTKKGTPINKLWTNVGALDGVDIHHHESFLTYEHNGDQVHLYRDLDRLKSSWIALSPEDKEVIESFYKTIKQLQSFEIPVEKPMDMMNILEKVKLMISMKDAAMVMQKYDKISLKDYAKSFKNPALKGALASLVPESYSASSLFFALATFSKGQASVPVGGSKAFAMRMKDRYISLGGTVEYRCEADELVIEDKKVVRVICNNGKSFEADYFIAACDAHMLYERLLKGKYNDKDFQKRFNNPIDYPLASEVRISLGYDGILHDLPRTLIFPVAKPFKMNETIVDLLQITNYNYEPTFAPEGKTLLSCSKNQYHTDYDVWNTLAKDHEAYQQEKNRIGKEVLKALETRFPQMKGKLTVLDVATPKTFERYCNSYRGSIMAFIPTIGGKMMSHPGNIDGLNNIFLCSHWLQPPGGLPVALITGKDVIQRICKKERRKFIME